MLYLLNKEELADLQQRPTKEAHETRRIALVSARMLIVKLNGGKCIHSEDRKDRLTYCDECPLHDLEPEDRDEICTLSKDYSQ